jgi:hypothetical protein
MVVLIVVALLAFAAFVLVTMAIVHGLPRIVRLAFATMGLAMVAAIPLSLHARAKAIRIGALLMGPQEFARGRYERSVRFDPLALCWEVSYSTPVPNLPTDALRVSLFGHVEFGSKYFMDRAREIDAR